MDPGQFLAALLAIVMIDIVLAGDNAIVIALASRNLPADLQKRAIIWGTVGAIAVRSLMTVLVVWLLKVPGLLLVGGLMLVWISWRLLVPAGDDHEATAKPVTGFWGAMRTIVIADAVMGLDNVLAVAGAAHGNYLLVVTGLLLSVPIVVWGSTLVLKLVDRYPGVVYLGAAMMLWTATKMIIGEPLLAGGFAAAPPAATLLYLVIPLVLWAGFAANHRRLESRIHQRLVQLHSLRPLAGQADAPSGSPTQYTGDRAMLKVLVPVDGSGNALEAVRHVIAEYQRHHELALHLVNVQPRLSRHIARFISRGERRGWQRAQAEAATAQASALLTRGGVPFETHWLTGDRADEICRISRELGVHHIVMGTARKNSLTRMLEDSVTSRVLEHAPVPVEVVPGAAVSRWERWGLPAGFAGVFGLVLLAFD